MKTRSLNPLHVVAALGLAALAAACGADPGDCFGVDGRQTCVYEVCGDDGASCHFEVHSQAMTKADLIEYLYGAKLPPPPPPPPPKK